MRRLLPPALVLLALVALAATATVPATAARTATQREGSLEQGVLREVNRVRAQHGLRPLALSQGLQAAAVFQSRSMLAQGFFDHASPGGPPFGERLRRYYSNRGFASWSVGENLFMGTGEIDAASAVRAWLASPGHRANLLAPSWREAGVGAFLAPAAPGVYAGAGGPVLVVTLDFGARGDATRATAAIAGTSAARLR